jgi:hypothetical protein
MAARLRPGALRPRADTAIAALALVVLVAAGIIANAAQPAPSTPYASTSAAGNGTLALYRWVAALGFRAQRLTAAPWRPGAARALFVLEPQIPFSAAEIAATVQWVRNGGTLILLLDGGDPPLTAAFHLEVTPLPGPGLLNALKNAPTPYGAAPLQPLLAHPPLRGLNVQAASGVYGTEPGVVPVLGYGGVRPPGSNPRARISAPDARNPILVYERLGRGRVYACSAPAVLTNSLIAAGENRRLVINVLAGIALGSAIGFDDYHLTATAPAPATLQDALTSTAWGRALLYALALVFAYLVLTGRRLGRPLPVVPERGRSLAEYVISMAAIFRRAALRTRVLALWQDDLRRSLAGAGGVRGRDDDALVGEAGQRHGLTLQEQQEALTLLRPRPTLDERTLLDLCRRIAAVQARLTRP